MPWYCGKFKHYKCESIVIILPYLPRKEEGDFFGSFYIWPSRFFSHIEVPQGKFPGSTPCSTFSKEIIIRTLSEYVRRWNHFILIQFCGSCVSFFFPCRIKLISIRYIDLFCKTQSELNFYYILRPSPIL